MWDIGTNLLKSRKHNVWNQPWLSAADSLRWKILGPNNGEGGLGLAGNNFGQQFNSDHKAPTVAKRREARFESGIGQRINHNTAMSSQFETVLTQFMVMANLANLAMMMLLMTMMLLLLLLLPKMTMMLLLLMMTMLLPLKLRRWRCCWCSWWKWLTLLSCQLPIIGHQSNAASTMTT